jgi:hypothetical protein
MEGVRIPTVLVVSSDPYLAAGLADLIRQAGFEVRIAPGGDEATDTTALVSAAVDSHASSRLAHKAVRFMSSPTDGPTLREFGRIVALSTGGLRNWCRTAGVGSREFLKFARGLRAVSLHARDASSSAEDLLDVVDRRTLIKFVASSGGTGLRLPGTVEEYLLRQRFVVKPAFLRAVHHALAHDLSPGVMEESRSTGRTEGRTVTMSLVSDRRLARRPRS